MSITIAIDGPTASGKGTLARKLADALGYACLDTGLLYRAVGMALKRQGLSPSDEAEAITAAKALNMDDVMDDADIRSAEAGQWASQVSAIPGVRQALLEFQRDFAQHEPGAVLDGRDIGTVICPQAQVKLYITASAEVRAQRRHKELLSRGQDKSYGDVLSDIIARDDRDMNRAVAPLRPATDAVIIDTSNMDPEKAFSVALALIRERLAEPARA